MKKILIVEDDEWLAEQYSRVLTRAGHKTLVTLHALGAIQKLDDFKPEIIILDILLTGGTAFPLMHELQSYQDTAIIPVIVCTNLADNFDIEQLRPYGVIKIIDKATMVPGDLPAVVESVS